MFVRWALPWHMPSARIKGDLLLWLLLMPTSTRRIPVILLQVRALLDARTITIGRRREAVLLILLNQVKSTLFTHFLLVKLLLAVLLLIESTVVRIFERVVGLL